jgi:hypothetical protein
MQALRLVMFLAISALMALGQCPHSMTEQEALRDERTCKEVCFGNDKGLGNCGLLNGAAISLPLPEWPRQVKAAGVSGVTVHAYVNENGKVYLAKACGKDHPALVRAAIAAAYKAVFHQTTCSGKPVQIDGLILYNFRPRKTHRRSFVGSRIAAAWTRPQSAGPLSSEYLAASHAQRWAARKIVSGRNIDL